MRIRAVNLQGIIKVVLWNSLFYIPDVKVVIFSLFLQPVLFLIPPTWFKYIKIYFAISLSNIYTDLNIKTDVLFFFVSRDILSVFCTQLGDPFQDRRKMAGPL
jgi:hypothetical protein